MVAAVMTNNGGDCASQIPLPIPSSLGRSPWSTLGLPRCSANIWQELVQQIKSNGMMPGVALKPRTPIEDVHPLLDGENPVEMVIVMNVESRFGGQKFILEMIDKKEIPIT
ncbi:Ribulose-phosphate 3-epimerase, cytoplasmic isoform [Camellia lanceoleosa]|uniref:Ribulose-phosphate 3-epimerase, cytoplasmic isoform n=1 Tax=Camellia lanceoleosa TaxID=1840588 RepID=A0ACC0I9A8_9ERIC|nr:Ribulose-phosphate 3-epimerase, cytoplasmic isoform [Camellia lanceoleosa]